jgi:2-iminobutanoate/2-iminopropanoate deaminase
MIRTLTRWVLVTAAFLSFPMAHSSQPMHRSFIRDAEAPKNSLYSQAVRAGNLVFVTGVIGFDPATNQPAGPTIQEQTRQSLVNCQRILEAAGVTLADVVEVQVLLARPDDFSGLNEAYAKFFLVDPPVRSVARLGPELPGVLVSIRMTAVARP